MFSTKLSRAAHRASTAHTAAAAAAAITASSSTACTSSRPSHQRRPSSSKASCPPDNSAAKAAPAAKADAAETQEAPVSGEQPSQKSNKGRSRGGYRRVGSPATTGKQVNAGPVDQFAGLPSVPNLHGIDAKDLLLSTFFSLHRPISVTTSIPPPATHEAFNGIFTSQRQRQALENPWENGNSAERRPEDVIYTLHQTIESLEKGAQSADEEGVRWEVIHESPSNSDGAGVNHLDGLPKMKSLDELVSQFRPFRAPPPPQPFPDSTPAPEKKAAAKTSTRGRPRQKTFTTTITVTESTYSDGQRTYSASSSPIVRMPDSQHQNHSIREPSTRQPFLTRMYRRGLAHSRTASTSYPQATASDLPMQKRGTIGERPDRVRRMYLISVKRQRKLKMKKHKYKKLMKRTRNLRRKLDRN